MRLSSLVGRSLQSDPEITGLSSDSRTVKPGYLFAALSGAMSDGKEYIPQAEKNGAVAVLAPPGAISTVVLIEDPQPRRLFAKTAARFFKAQPSFIAGVTGTNGKTSTARFAAQLFEGVGEASASLGTLGAEGANYRRATRLTTPEPVMLHETLAEMCAAGVTHLAMEVSSHALDQARADGVNFAAAAFSNITQDHLDFHGSFEAYCAAKVRLFSELLSEDGVGVVNTDGAGADRILAALRDRSVRTITVGRSATDLKLHAARPDADGVIADIAWADGEATIRLPLIGAFQVDNALLAAGIVMAAGFKAEIVLPLLEGLQGVPGRMERIATCNGASVYVDYAHTPDALSRAIAAIRPHANKRLITIIGAGGDRDKEKRPLMGRAAAASDLVIVTDDNPRTEDPAAIRAEVIAGAPAAREIGDRAEAISQGVRILESGDILLIAGKGHETGQTIGTETIAFDDGDAARKAVAYWRDHEG